MFNTRMCSYLTVQCDPRLGCVRMDAERWVNGLLEHSPEGVKVLPTPFDAVEHKRTTLKVQRHLNPQRIGHFPQGHVARGLAHRQLAILKLQAPGHGVVAEAAVVSPAKDALVAHPQRPHGVGPDVHHPHVLAAREALAAQDLGRGYETLRVILVGLLGGAVPDRAQVCGHHQADVGRVDVEGEVQRVEEDMEGIQEAGRL